ncbi:MAG: hypothetical protein VKS61_01450 [Candidatus Sericytochromatia bacterium]|nr:hypothetical protein [Candidatus Sericytochromatia bacterium]
MFLPCVRRLATRSLLALLALAAFQPPALAIGQVVIFRDVALSERYQALSGRLTRLQIQARAEQDTTVLRAKKLTCRAVVQEVFPPEPNQVDPEACRVVLALTAISGFTAAELPAVTYWVSRTRALTLRLNSPLTVPAELFAIEPNGAVAIELETPAGWLDLTMPTPAPAPR